MYQWQNTEKGHGHITTRTVMVTTQMETMNQELREKWPQLRSLITNPKILQQGYNEAAENLQNNFATALAKRTAQ